jgi:hypothetical protein
MITLEKSTGMTLPQLEATPEFGRLSPKMKLWVSSYVQHFIDFGSLDPIFATKSSYQCGSDENARTFGYQILSKTKVQALLKLYAHFGKSQLELDLETAEEQFRQAKPGSEPAHNLLVLTMRLRKEIAAERAANVEASAPQVPAVAPEPKRFNVGDIILVDGKKVRVTAVNEAGRATDGEPLED